MKANTKIEQLIQDAIFMVIFTTVLVIFKLCNVLPWDWPWVFLPLLVYVITATIIVIIQIIIIIKNKRRN